MKIFGLGTDIVNTNRVKNSLRRTKSLKSRLFTSMEISYCDKKKDSFKCYAKRFAAKEAFAKALGLGISKGLKFKEIEIKNNKLGQPFINVLGNSKKIVNKLLNKRLFKIHLSISDDNSFTIATVILTIK